MAELNFEQALQRLEEIVAKLEAGDPSLNESLKMFEEGIRLSRLCSRKLEEAERKVEILLTTEDGKRKTQPFELGQQRLFEETDEEVGEE